LLPNISFELKRRIKKPSIPGRTGGFDLFSDSLPSAGIIQQVRGVIPIVPFGISQPVQLPQQIFFIIPFSLDMSSEFVERQALKAVRGEGARALNPLRSPALGLAFFKR
jgi:hypothetical protein